MKLLKGLIEIFKFWLGSWFVALSASVVVTICSGVFVIPVCIIYLFVIRTKEFDNSLSFILAIFGLLVFWWVCFSLSRGLLKYFKKEFGEDFVNRPFKNFMKR